METATLAVAAPYLIEQNYLSYTQDQHSVWAELVSRALPELEKHAAREYLDGFEIIGLERGRLPNLSAISARLEPRTGWRSTPVSGFLPAPAFFEMLAARRFPTTTWLRSRDSLEYTPEPDIFHDVFGHVPMHAHAVFADFLERYGRVCASISDAGVLEKLGRLFWYTVEFGLIRQNGQIKVYGSGLISSHGECLNVISGHCAIRDFTLDEVLETPVKVDELHKLLFAVAGFDQIYEAMHEAELRALRGLL
ncbi:MAG TPA: phenylalanine 4-monooxygenase [Terracidiphilus sp.]|nr:phenylalanine 4-monooxygenase [Terracidiphilus sp.]